MAGNVGGAVAGAPGYAGYIPSCQVPHSATTCGVASRKPLEERRQATQTIGLSGTVAATEDDLLKDPTVAFLPKRSCVSTLYQAQGSIKNDPGDWAQPKTKAALLLGSEKRRETAAVPGSKFAAKSLYGDNTLERNKDPSFFSKVQQREQRDADSDAMVSNAAPRLPTQKKLEKRQNDPGMHLPSQQFDPSASKRSAAAVHTGIPELRDYVKFHAEFQQLSSYTKEYGPRGHNPSAAIPATKEQLSMAMSTGDLTPGTTKSALGLRLPGYMGHVPAGEKAASSMDRTDRPDYLKMNAKNTRILTSCQRTMPGYSGYEPKSLANDRGRSNNPDLNQTSSGLAGSQVLRGSSEKAMNKSTFAKQHAVRKFFTSGGLEPDHTIAEQYFVKYRPMEGSLKMGATSERSIPRVK